MKKGLGLFLALVWVASVCGLAQAAEEGLASKVIVYYFHGSFRCYTCNMMEKYSREAMDTNFKQALDSGKLEFQAVNVEERDNRHFIQDYQLYTKSLILSLVKDGQEIKAKNLDKIWEYARDKQQCIDYVTQETKALLEEAK